MRPIIVPIVVFAICASVLRVILRSRKAELTGRLRDNARNVRMSKPVDRFGIPGIIVADDLLDRYGLIDYDVMPTGDPLRNRCDFEDKLITLSSHVYDGNTVVSAAVAAHEASHAVMDERTGWLTRAKSLANVLRKATLIEICACFCIGIVAYGLGVVDNATPWVPVLGGWTLFMACLAFGITECVIEWRASMTAIMSLRLEYPVAGRRIARVADFLKTAWMTYLLTALADTTMAMTIALVLTMIA